MPSLLSPTNHPLRAAVIIGACLFAAYLLPIFGLFLGSNFIFFAPHILFPYQIMVTNENPPGGPYHMLFNQTSGLLLNYLQWGLIILGFVCLARRLKTGPTILAAVVTIALVGFITNSALDSLGLHLQIDAP
jgi:hypothetical protein